MKLITLIIFLISITTSAFGDNPLEEGFSLITVASTYSQGFEPTTESDMIKTTSLVAKIDGELHGCYLRTSIDSSRLTLLNQGVVLRFVGYVDETKAAMFELNSDKKSMAMICYKFNGARVEKFKLNQEILELIIKDKIIIVEDSYGQGYFDVINASGTNQFRLGEPLVDQVLKSIFFPED